MLASISAYVSGSLLSVLLLLSFLFWLFFFFFLLEHCEGEFGSMSFNIWYECGPFDLLHCGIGFW